MIERRADQFRLEPTSEQQQKFRRIAGCRRWVRHRALEIQLKRLDEKQPLLTYYDLAKLLTEWRNAPNTEWLAESPVHTQQAVLRDLDKTFRQWRNGKCKLPRFKKRGCGDSFRYPDHKQIKFDFKTQDDEGRKVLPKIFLPKVGWVKFRQSRQLSGEVCNATLVCRAGHWDVSIQVEKELSPEPIPQTAENTIAGDIGMSLFLQLSDGSKIEKPKNIQRIEETLTIAQRKLSRMKPGSKNYTRQKKRIQRLHKKVACARRDFLHKTSTQLSKNHAYVKLEDARVSRMIQTPESEQHKEEGKTRKSMSRFNRGLLDLGWSMFLFYLDYKLRARGGGLIVVNPAYTSQECSLCHFIHEDNRPSRDQFHCLACHHEDDAHLNAAKNILKRAGHARFACESPSNGGSAREGQTEKHGSNTVPSL